MTKRQEPNKVIGFKVEKSKPEESLETYARMLSEASDNEKRARQDAEAYRVNAMNERQKGLELQNIIFDLKQRKRIGAGPVLNKYGRPSRMHPLNNYSLEKCEKELAKCKFRQSEFQKTADHYDQEAVRLNGKVNEYTIKIRDFNKNRDVEYYYFNE